MAKFTIRVVLHGVTDLEHETYKKLHRLMAEAGFLTTILGGDGVTYKMPPAEYNYVAEKTHSEVRDLVSLVVAKIDANYGVFVTTGDRSWQGLRPVT